VVSVIVKSHDLIHLMCETLLGELAEHGQHLPLPADNGLCAPAFIQVFAFDIYRIGLLLILTVSLLTIVLTVILQALDALLLLHLVHALHVER
jgi:hypothetical protein